MTWYRRCLVLAFCPPRPRNQRFLLTTSLKWSASRRHRHGHYRPVVEGVSRAEEEEKEEEKEEVKEEGKSSMKRVG